MKERPIIFGSSMIRAIIDGTKTQTRRIVQSPARTMQREGMTVIKHRAAGDSWYGDYVWSMRNKSGVWGDYTNEKFLRFCHYGQPGDRLWVRETWGQPDSRHEEWDFLRGPPRRDLPVLYRASWADFGDGEHWRPSIHMPRWASRITLEVTDVRVERLQDISEDDARDEGIPQTAGEAHGLGLFDMTKRNGHEWDNRTSRENFANLWDSINQKRAPWSSNPFVWAITFRRLP